MTGNRWGALVCRVGRPGSDVEAGGGVERRPDRLAAASVRGDTPLAAEERHDSDSATGSVEGSARTHDVDDNFLQPAAGTSGWHGDPSRTLTSSDWATPAK